MNALEISSIVASFVSTVLAVFAIWLALYMFNQSKDTERRVSENLASIRSQTDTLQKLTGKMMDRLTTAVTAPRAADEAIVLLMSTIRDIPTALATHLRTPGRDATQGVLRNEVLTAYIATYYYAGIANVWSQGYLPALEDLEDDNPVKRMVDASSADFQLLESLIGGFDSSLVESNRLHHLHAEASEQWKPHVKDSTTVYRDRQAEV